MTPNIDVRVMTLYCCINCTYFCRTLFHMEEAFILYIYVYIFLGVFQT